MNRNGMVARVEVDRGVFRQRGIAIGGQLKQAAKRRNRARCEAGKLLHFLASGKAEPLDAEAFAGFAIIELAVGWYDKKDEAVAGFDDQGLGPAGQWGAANRCGLLAGVDRLVPEHGKKDIGTLQ